MKKNKVTETIESSMKIKCYWARQVTIISDSGVGKKKIN